MSHLYINIEPKQKHLSTDREDLRTHKSSSYDKLDSKSFERGGTKNPSTIVPNGWMHQQLYYF